MAPSFIMDKTMHSISQVAAAVGLTTLEVVCMYEYGSRVYGTNGKGSDYDYVIITEKEGFTAEQAETGDINVHAFHMDVWKKRLEDHDIMAMECNSTLLDDLVLPFTLDKSKLRSVISRTASNSWVKCKKKLTVEVDARRVGIKSLFHSFRIPMFGIQMAEHGRIKDFTCANFLWDEMEPLIESDVTWEEINEKYKKLHNQWMTEFRKVAEK